MTRKVEPVDRQGPQGMPLTNQAVRHLLSYLCPNVSLVGPVSIQIFVSCYLCDLQSQPDCRPCERVPREGHLALRKSKKCAFSPLLRS